MWEGIALGGLTFVGFWAIFRKLPGSVKRIASNPKVAWITDIVLTIGAYALLSGISGSFGAAIGCAIAGISVSVYLGYYGEGKWKKLHHKNVNQ